MLSRVEQLENETFCISVDGELFVSASQEEMFLDSSVWFTKLLSQKKGGKTLEWQGGTNKSLANFYGQMLKVKQTPRTPKNAIV